MEKQKFVNLGGLRAAVAAAAGGSWVILWRDHYRGNAAGEAFRASDLESVIKNHPYLFTCDDRPVYAFSIITDSVPAFQKMYKSLLNIYNRYEISRRDGLQPLPVFDRRKTRRTAPEIFSKVDRITAENTRISEKYERLKKITSEEMDQYRDFANLLILD